MVRRRQIKRRHPVAKRKKGFNAGRFLFFLVLISLSCLYIWQRVTIVALAKNTKELKLAIKSRQETLKYLQIEVTELNSIERLQEKAELMGLVYPPLDQIEWIREESDSVYLEKNLSQGGLWAKLTALRSNLFAGDGAIAREIEHEP
jgi:cell division protein FtsL